MRRACRRRRTWRRRRAACLGRLAAGVGVDLGVEHQHVDVASAGQHVVQAAEADVVGPAVAADDPDALLRPGVGDDRAVALVPASDAARASFCFERRHPLPLVRRCRPRSSGRPSRISVDQVVADVGRAGARAGRGAYSSLLVERRGGSRGRTRRCPRRASWTRPGRGPRGWWSRAWSAGCRRRSTSSRWRWRSAAGRRRAGDSSFR